MRDLPPMAPTHAGVVTAAEELPLPVSKHSWALNVIAAVSVIFLLRYAMELFVPIVLAILLSYALDPIVTAVCRLRVGRPAATALVLLTLIGGVGFGSYKLKDQTMTAVDSLPKAAEQIRQKLRTLGKGQANDPVTKIQRAAQQVEQAVTEATAATGPEPIKVTKVRIEAPYFRTSDFLWSGSVSLINGLSQTVLVLSLTLFILASGDLFKRKLVTVIGDRLSAKRITLDAINEINKQIERFLVMQIVTGAIVAAGTGLILWGFGVASPIIWGIAAGVTSVVPYFGAIATIAAVTLVTFLQFGSMSTPIAIFGAMLVFRTLESVFLIPALMGKAAGINGVAMFLGLLFWGWAWGTIGLIVAVPFMMVCKIVCDRTQGLHSVGELLSERPVKV